MEEILKRIFDRHISNPGSRVVITWGQDYANADERSDDPADGDYIVWVVSETDIKTEKVEEWVNIINA
jgi:hypothetical protein